MITVTNTNNAGAGSLRQAIADAAVGEQIVFGVTGTIALGSELFIDKNLKINGPGIGSMILTGGGAVRVFNVDSGVVEITGLMVINGAASEGAGIHNEGTLTLINILVAGCASSDDGGGIWNGSTVNMEDCTVSNCTAVANGGGIHNTGTLNITDVNVASCSNSGDGGGVWNNGTYTHLRGTINENNSNGLTGGGGVYNAGTFSPADMTIRDNISNGNGGGIGNFFGTVEMVRCTTSGNGLGIYNSIGTVNLDNSTVSGHTGAGIYTTAGGVCDLKHATITANEFGYIQEAGALLTMQNTIFCGNTSTDIEGETAELISGGNNIFGVELNPVTPGPDDQQGVAAAAVALGPLQDNGGPTFTHALLTGSVAIDAGNSAAAPATDQRGAGFPRVIDGTIDIGAYESDLEVCLTFTGELPSWVTISGDCLIGAAGTFSGDTQEAANAAAQAALNAFAEAALESGDLVCASAPCSSRESEIVDGELTAASPQTTFRGLPGIFYSHTFPISVVAGQNLSIWCGSADFDVWLILLDSSQTTEIDHDDIHGFFRVGDLDNGVLNYTPGSSGTLYVQVTTFTAEETGVFRAIVSQGHEYANTPIQSPWTSIYVASTGKVFVAGPYERENGGAFVYVIDPVTNAMNSVATYAAPSKGRPVLFYNPNDDSVWTMADDGGSVFFVRLNPNTGAVIETFAAPPSNFFFPAYVPGVNKLFAGKQDNVSTNKIAVYNCLSRSAEPDITIFDSGQETIGVYIPEIDRVVLETSGAGGYQILNPNDNTLSGKIASSIFIRYGFYKDGLYYGFEGSGNFGTKIMAVTLTTGAETHSIVDANKKWGIFYDACRDCLQVVTSATFNYSITALNLDDFSMIDTVNIGEIGEFNQWPSLINALNVHRAYFIIGGNVLSPGPPMIGTAFKIA